MTKSRSLNGVLDSENIIAVPARAGWGERVTRHAYATEEQRGSTARCWGEDHSRAFHTLGNRKTLEFPSRGCQSARGTLWRRTWSGPGQRWKSDLRTSSLQASNVKQIQFPPPRHSVHVRNTQSTPRHEARSLYQCWKLSHCTRKHLDCWLWCVTHVSKQKGECKNVSKWQANIVTRTSVWLLLLGSTTQANTEGLQGLIYSWDSIVLKALLVI